MAVVNRVAQLEDEDGVSATSDVLSAQLFRGNTELVEAIVVLKLLEDFQIAADQEVTAGVNHLGVRVSAVGEAEGAGAAFFFVMVEDFKIAHDGDGLARR